MKTKSKLQIWQLTIIANELGELLYRISTMIHQLMKSKHQVEIRRLRAGYCVLRYLHKKLRHELNEAAELKDYEFCDSECFMLEQQFCSLEPLWRALACHFTYRCMFYLFSRVNEQSILANDATKYATLAGLISIAETVWRIYVQEKAIAGENTVMLALQRINCKSKAVFCATENLVELRRKLRSSKITGVEYAATNSLLETVSYRRVQILK
jgi:hypothetical protein